MITTSEIKISVVIKKDAMKDAVVALHDAFELEEI
jgi:aspartokinase